MNVILIKFIVVVVVAANNVDEIFKTADNDISVDRIAYIFYRIGMINVCFTVVFGDKPHPWRR